MLQALKSSPEKKELVDLAIKYLRGVKGHLVQQKKKDKERSAMQAAGIPIPGPSRPPQNAGEAGGGSGQSGAGVNEVRMGYGPPPPGFGQGLPRRFAPPTYHAPIGLPPGSVGSHFVGSHFVGQGQRGVIRQQRAGFGPSLEDYDVESALRGFLGR